MVPGENSDWVTITGMIIISFSLIWFFGVTGRKERRMLKTPAGPMAK
jgi:hypothetical protein